MAMSEFSQQTGAKNVAKHKAEPQGQLSIVGGPLAYQLDDPVWKQAALHVQSLSQATLLFTVKKRTDPPEVAPTGIAIAICKQVIVNRDSDFILS